MKLADILAESRASLAAGGVDDANLDARLLVEHFSGTTRTDAISRPEMPVSVEAVAGIRAAVARRVVGEPVHRIIGFREFYGLRLFLSAETLEPRPDTEILVDAALARLRSLAPAEGGLRILDLGTGTGAVALSLLSEMPEARAVGTDISADALATATRNALENRVSERFEAVFSDWFEKIFGTFHAIVSNPPYIRSEELETLQREVRNHDPQAALDGGADGLDAYRSIAQGSKEHLEEDGFVAVEIGHTQQAEVIDVFAAHGLRFVESRQDFGGRDRVLVFVLEENPAV
ncbi:MAG: peptide chain release factor N(5)-glutamine methyltransferase [Rhizobiaceae bacterium]|nr:peptide chain release factor N(5)-glutamine methyltransferase [Rhizobiaceae bacterium]